ncbi:MULTISPECIES: hypothetical protein [Streptomyces]|uniref:hypothetical protein n=1 Tax=Streptomyces TaxID=1883 RepID=UPI001F1D6827|nr:hypothetical protein [Streptomyces noursei]MCE4942830.1 hypothetical protein [Streptomyces noursei]
MGALLWLLIPVLAGLIAALWSSWAVRNRRTGDVAELAGYARFRAAMEKQPAAAAAPTVPERVSDPV